METQRDIHQRAADDLIEAGLDLQVAGRLAFYGAFLATFIIFYHPCIQDFSGEIV
jgi:hypothetical protein